MGAPTPFQGTASWIHEQRGPFWTGDHINSVHPNVKIAMWSERDTVIDGAVDDSEQVPGTRDRRIAVQLTVQLVTRKSQFRQEPSEDRGWFLREDPG